MTFKTNRYKLHHHFFFIFYLKTDIYHKNEVLKRVIFNEIILFSKGGKCLKEFLLFFLYC